jgi:hypothetical protein
LPTSSTCDHDLAVEVIEPSDKWFDLADLIVSFDVELPKISSVLLVELLFGLISVAGDALSH